MNIPSFRSRRASSVGASAAKSRVRCAGTKPELALRRELWRRGARYRLNAVHLPGRPDIVFPRHAVAVFCDGDFWHGRDWSIRRAKLLKGANAEYWIAKIEYNIRRDKVQEQQLRSMNWKILRYWEREIAKDPGAVADQILSLLKGM